MPSVSCDQSARQVKLKIDSHPANIAPVRKALEELGQRCGFDEQAVNDIGLCVNEALANVMRHAYCGCQDRPIEVKAECDESSMRIEMRDWGNGVDPSSLAPKKKDPLTPGGLGLICLCQMMDQVKYEPQGDGMLLTMVRSKSKRAAG